MRLLNAKKDKEDSDIILKLYSKNNIFEKECKKI